jgi:glycine betaine/choline ABC-type transport system substrate-binding protein
MGIVYRAWQLVPERVVALKAIAPAVADDPGFRERFKRESQLAAAIEHPNVIPVYEVGEHGGVLFIAMRFVDGTDLGALIDARAGLDPVEATHLVGQVAGALDAAHARGLVHRDVKPANVMVAGGPGERHAYLADFGLAKNTGSETGLTSSGVVVGTVDYIAPEQVRGERVDARTDVYSLGCLLFKALTGRVPYLADTTLAKMYAHAHEPVPSIAALVPGLPPDLDAVVQRAMAKDPADRFPSAGDFARAARAAAASAPVPPAATEKTVALGDAAPAATTVAAAPPPRRRSRRPAAVAMLAVLGVLAAVGVAVALSAGGGDGGGGGGEESTPRAQAPALPAGKPGRGRSLTLGVQANSEQQLLGELYSQVLTSRGYIVNTTEADGEQELDEELVDGSIDAYPAYVDEFVSRATGQEGSYSSAREIHAAAVAAAKQRDQIVTALSPLHNVAAIAVTAHFAEANGVRSVGDLDRPVLGAGTDFENSWGDQLRELYGVAPRYRIVDNTPDVYAALDAGQIDAAGIYTTEGELSKGDYRVLADPEHIFGFENITVAADKKKVDELGPAFVRIVDAVNAKLTSEAMQEMVLPVDNGDKTAKDVAAAFLAANGLSD